MKDKIYFIAGCLAAPFWQADKLVTWNGTAWILDEFAWGTFCAELANRGVNMMRWLAWTSWEKNTPVLNPFLQEPDGRYNPDKRNPEYWRIVDRMIAIANYPAQATGIQAPGIVVYIDLFFQYYRDADDQARSPWRNNTLGATSLYDEAIRPAALAFMKEWFSLGRKHKMVFGMGNEMESDGIEFGYFILRTMDQERVWPFSYGIGPEIPATSDMENFKLFSLMIHRENLFAWYRPTPNFEFDVNIFRPVHGCGEQRGDVDVLDTALDYWAGNPIRLLASDDGDFTLAGPDGKPSAEQWRAMTRRIFTWRGGTDAVTYPWSQIESPRIGIEHLPDGWTAEPEKELATFQAIGETYAEFFGPLENAGQWPKWKKPEPPAPPTPDKPHFNLKGEWANNKAWILAGIGLILLVLFLILVF